MNILNRLYGYTCPKTFISKTKYYYLIHMIFILISIVSFLVFFLFPLPEKMRSKYYVEVFPPQIELINNDYTISGKDLYFSQSYILQSVLPSLKEHFEILRPAGSFKLILTDRSHPASQYDNSSLNRLISQAMGENKELKTVNILKRSSNVNYLIFKSIWLGSLVGIIFGQIFTLSILISSKQKSYA